MDPNLINYIRRYIGISEEEIRIFQDHLHKKALKKKEFLLREGQICRARYFITKGILRLFYLDKKENEQIIHFGVEHWWITDYDSLLNEHPSHLNIQALEDVELLVLNQSSFDQLCFQLPKVERFFRIIMEKTYIAAQRRMEYMFSLSGEEIYKTFFEANPEFVLRIPQYMLASYLGFTPEFLSKIKAKKD